MKTLNLKKIINIWVFKFSSNCKWHCHIQNILKSTSGQLSILHKFKIKLKRENLEKIYFTKIRPLLEYACELWDCCTILDLNEIEQIQHEAARIVTGLPTFASIESLYFETGWEPLYSRRHSRKLNLFLFTKYVIMIVYLIYTTVYCLLYERKMN